ncbi:MAG TPA: ParB/RepB/Spo0J family partition protein [Mucilaginibacter sp.]|jgi:ParB/RepB/Spo0J family partition protein
MESKNKLKDIPLDLIDPNPDNPRMYFRQEELDDLLISIKKFGIQVPISVYSNGDRYILIDGERRWRTSKKLNLKTIPAIVQAKPNELDNLLMMFNIHSLREQWDLFTIANKISKVISLLAKDLGKQPLENEISLATGLNKTTIRRCKLLIELPDKYKDQIKKELEVPKSKQKISEDFFIEMESSLKTVSRNYPAVIQNVDEVRDNLIDKYRNGTIKNLVDFRQIGKLATAHKNVNFSKTDSEKALRQIFFDKRSGIAEVYNQTVGELYTEKRFIGAVDLLAGQIETLSPEEKRDPEIKEALSRLVALINNTIDGL